MIFRNPIAWLGLVALAVPVAIHLLVRAPAEPLVLPSLRFVPRSRMRALRRRFLTDRGLLAVRLGILALAAAALANPLLATACRTSAWDARRARAIVFEGSTAVESPRLADLGAATEQREFRTNEGGLQDALARAAAWLSSTAPARREIVVIGPLAAGAIDAGDLAAVPAPVGLRFLREGTLPASRRVEGSTFTAGLGRTIVRRSAPVILEGPLTRREPARAAALIGVAAGGTIRGEVKIESFESGVRVPALGVEALGSRDAPHGWRDALAAALSVGVPLPAGSAPHPVVFAFAPGPAPAPARWKPWMADIIARVTADPSVADESRVAVPSSAARPGDGWTTLATNADGEVVAAAAPVERADADALAVAARVETSSPLLAALARAALRAREDQRPAGAEVVPIDEATLKSLERAAAPVTTEIVDGSGLSDRRWFWTVVLGLLGFETWLRRRQGARGHEGGRESFSVSDQQ